jgi:AbrB family looped-hinge helix DNA binding protein
MSKVTQKFQITIPRTVRKSLGIIPGGEIDIVQKGSEFVLRVNPIEGLKRVWRGRFKDKKSSDAYMAEIRGDIE